MFGKYGPQEQYLLDQVLDSTTHASITLPVQGLAMQLTNDTLDALQLLGVVLS